GAAVVVLLAAGALAAWLVVRPSHPSGKLETNPTEITVIPAPPPPPPPPKKHHKKAKQKPKPAVPVDKPCWLNFGGNPQRTLARVDINLGIPTKALWGRGMGGYMEYPPSYCDGTLYVNTFKGTTFEIGRAHV